MKKEGLALTGAGCVPVRDQAGALRCLCLLWLGDTALVLASHFQFLLISPSINVNRALTHERYLAMKPRSLGVLQDLQKPGKQTSCTNLYLPPPSSSPDVSPAARCVYADFQPSSAHFSGDPKSQQGQCNISCVPTYLSHASSAIMARKSFASRRL